jgi:hypothetical protein
MRTALLTGLRRPLHGVVFGLLALTPVAAGCGASSGNLAPVGGRVTLDARPLPGARVRFEPETPGGSPSSGTTDHDGYYKLGFKRGVAGALVGKHTVRIESADFVGDGGTMIKAKLLPERYNRQSELSVEVKAGEENDIDFELTSGAR